MDRQAKFPASAAGRLFNVLEIFSTFLAAHRTAAKEIHTGAYVLSQCSFSTIISQCFSVLSSVLMTNIQFAPITPPGFRQARRGLPFCGPRYPLPKTKNVADLVHYLSERGQFVFHFLIFAFKILLYFFRSGGHGLHAPPPWLRPCSDQTHLVWRSGVLESTERGMVALRASLLNS